MNNLSTYRTIRKNRIVENSMCTKATVSIMEIVREDLLR